MNTLEREKKGEEEKRDLRRTRRGDPSRTSRKAATTAMMTITTAAKRTAMKKARDLVRASSAGFELSFEWILCIFGGLVKKKHYLFAFANITIYIALCLGVDRCWSLSYVDPVDVRQRLPQVAHPLTHAVDGKYSSHCTSDSQQFQLAKLWMVFEWTGPNLQWRELHPPVGNLCASLLRSALRILLGFVAKLAELMISFFLEFELHLKQVFQIYDIEEMVIRMADRTWTVSIHDLHLDAEIFNYFVAALRLEFLDYLLVVMLPNLQFRIIVLDVPLVQFNILQNSEKFLDQVLLAKCEDVLEPDIDYMFQSQQQLLDL
ncbi:hypothetical protein RHGRI_030564 [Rhododendron griersonianum]|uniref:Uncharacterized protein n=1 Tax=Rhododendron griersonianum TaxID=479676 RepID=A0AAV6IQS2_9ERIC|nr:hypothetical protein RHGRI_030564 [Rhododendron griersonianum]